MKNNIKLPCGLDKSGKVVYINNAKNGVDCECHCPACKQPLVAKNNGLIREHHFAHLNSVECEHGYQSALHFMAKDCFLELEYLSFIKNGLTVKYKIDSVVLERKVSNIVPDILIICDGKPFIVEIFVTHAVNEEKKAKIKALKISAVEIDLSRFRNEIIEKEMLMNELTNIQNFSWIYDADYDLIEEKRIIIQQFGIKRPIEIGDAIGCSLLVNQTYFYKKFVTLDFCLHCHNCVYHNGQKFISCAQFLPSPINLDTRKKLSVNIFVNDNKVFFLSEQQEYEKNFQKNLERAVNLQYRIFCSIGSYLNTSSASYVSTYNSSSKIYGKTYNNPYHHK